MYCIIIFVIFVHKWIKVDRIYKSLVEMGVSTIGVTNPSRNVQFYGEIFIKPNEHYISFIVFGATSGFIFHQYIMNIATSDDI